MEWPTAPNNLLLVTAVEQCMNSGILQIWDALVAFSLLSTIP